MVYRVDRNDFYTQQKKATIYTPAPVAQFVYNIVSTQIPKNSLVFDPAVGAGALLEPFTEYRVLGVDIEYQGFDNTIIKNFLQMKKQEMEMPALVICNPPFNIDIKTKQYIKQNYTGRPLLPEVWLQKIIELFGKDIPLVLFAPYGFRLNQQCNSRRWQRFANNEYPEISSIISLPKNIFENILFHSEILIFNVNGLKGHYFYNG